MSERDVVTREQVLAGHRPDTGTMYNGFSDSYMTCSCGWEGTPGDPAVAGVELVGHILDVLGLADAAAGSVWTLRDLATDLVHNSTQAQIALRERRQDLGVPVRELADRMGMPPADVQQLERYDAELTLSQLRRYALAVHARLTIDVAPVEVAPAAEGKDER